MFQMMPQQLQQLALMQQAQGGQQGGQPGGQMQQGMPMQGGGMGQQAPGGMSPGALNQLAMMQAPPHMNVGQAPHMQGAAGGMQGPPMAPGQQPGIGQNPQTMQSIMQLMQAFNGMGAGAAPYGSTGNGGTTPLVGGGRVLGGT